MAVKITHYSLDVIKGSSKSIKMWSCVAVSLSTVNYDVFIKHSVND